MDLIPVHKHCKVCGKPVPPEDITCSEACAKKRVEAMRNRQIWTYLFYGVALFLVILLFHSYL
jgi:predicted nucleic acid-binding Zn ribbon protein